MGFGLHAGWAIEGAVGSMYKVDATYLSPHVNMAARLETSSRQYGVPLLFSHFVEELLSPEVKEKCRRVDVVTVKGSEVPVGVFTYDCLESQVFKVKPEPKQTGKKQAAKPTAEKEETATNTAHAVAATIAHLVSKNSVAKSNYQAQAPVDIDFAEGFLSASSAPQESGQSMKKHGSSAALKLQDEEDVSEGFFCNNANDTVDIFEMDDDLLMLRAHVANNDEFDNSFTEGVKVYLDGDWGQARKLLEKANKIMAAIIPGSAGDGPCLTLLEYMEERDWKAPADWAGFRPLTSK
jgi:hypothetical protein